MKLLREVSLIAQRAVRRARFRAPRAIGRYKAGESRKKEETIEKLKAHTAPQSLHLLLRLLLGTVPVLAVLASIADLDC